MGRFLAAVFTDLERHSLQWTRTPRDRMVAAIAEYRYLAETVASQHGAVHHNFTGDGHLFLFESPDAAVQFAFRLVSSYNTGASIAGVRDLPPLPLRVGCHFGECTELDCQSWIGRAINLAKQVEGAAEPNSVYVTENVLGLIDLPLYSFEGAGRRALKGDHLPERELYRITRVDTAALAERADHELTAEAWFLRGVGLIGTAEENSEEEARCYRQALSLRGDYPEAHNNLAILLRAAGDLEGAAQHYREALRLRPDYPEAHYNYALLLEAQGRSAGAIEHHRQALRLRPDYADAHQAYATLLRSKGDHTAARQHYEKALAARPAFPEAHNNYAILLEDVGELAQSEIHYIEALRLRPAYAEAHYNLALLLERLERSDEASRHYQAALTIWPAYAEAHNNLAVLLHVTGDLDGAETHYRKALSLRPNDPEAHHNFALLLLAKGEEQQAEHHFRTARELAPDTARFTSAIEPPH